MTLGKFLGTITISFCGLIAIVGVVGGLSPSSPSTSTSSTAAAKRDARTSLSVSFLNFETYCKDEYSALTGTERYNVKDYIGMHQRAYGTFDPQLFNKDYAEYRKYGNLWCANIASMAKAISKDYSLVQKP